MTIIYPVPAAVTRYRRVQSSAPSVEDRYQSVLAKIPLAITPGNREVTCLGKVGRTALLSSIEWVDASGEKHLRYSESLDQQFSPVYYQNNTPREKMP